MRAKRLNRCTEYSYLLVVAADVNADQSFLHADLPNFTTRSNFRDWQSPCKCQTNVTEKCNVSVDQGSSTEC
jgi:hypothetical protein